MKTILFQLVVGATIVLPLPAAEFWVAPGGADTNSGSRELPFATPAKAQRQAREARRLGNAPTNEPVKIILRGGTYRLTSPLVFRPEDSGVEASPTIVEAAPGEKPVLSGGVPVTGWRKLGGKVSGLPKAARGKVWVADAPYVGGRVLEFRQLWVNDRKATRARTPNDPTMERLLVWDKTNRVAWLPASALAGVRNASQMELIIQQIWEIAILRVQSVRFETNAACVTFHEPESKIQFEHPWPPPVMSTNGNAPFFLANRLEFLDEPGEWVEDLAAGKVYYWPRAGEDLTKADVVAPALETLAQIDGTLERRVENLQFRGITFAHTTWLRPAHAGHVPLQAGMFLLEAYKLSPKGLPGRPGLDNQAWVGRPPAAVMVDGASGIRFERCRFERLAMTGLDFTEGTQDDLVEGCVFRDIGGNGLQLGEFNTDGDEAHFAFNPADERVICSREKIANNAFTDCGNEDWGCVGICVGYARNVAITHNDVHRVPYSGISAGWGWTKLASCLSSNLIHANRVHEFGQRVIDFGGIYTLSAQPGTVISENDVHDVRLSPYVNDPNHWFYLYTDEGSSYMTVRDNWTPAEKFLQNANGPGMNWTNNGPQVSEAIKQAAGLEPAFQDLLSAEE